MIDSSPRIGSADKRGGLETEDMVDTTGPALAAIPAEERDETLAEVRQLIEHLRNAAQDAPQLARRYAETLQTVVEEYSREFEHRADALLARLEARQ